MKYAYTKFTRYIQETPRDYIPTKVVIFKHIFNHSILWAYRPNPYHPVYNGQCERMHTYIINLLRGLCNEEKSKWLIHAYNIMLHGSTGCLLMFGLEEQLPID